MDDRSSTESADADALLARYRGSGSPKDLASLFDATAGDLYRVAVATAPDAATAEDAVQETFLAVIDAAARWDPTRRAMPWLLGILRFKLMRLRERARRATPANLATTQGVPVAGSLPAAEDRAGDDATPAADPEAAAAAWAQIERLDDPYRGVALLRWRYGLSPAEIAHVRGEAPGTTRSLLSRALSQLRRALLVVPAIFASGRDARGLDAVRDAVTRAAARPTGATGATGATDATGMSALGTRIAIAAGVLLVAGGAFLWFRSDDAEPTPTMVASAADALPAEAATTPALAAAPGQTTGMSSPSATAPKAVARGRVLGPDGKPVPGANVTSVSSDAFAFATPAGFDVAATTERVATAGADGSFAVALDESEPLHLLFVTAPRLAPTVVGPLRTGASIDVTLSAGETWSGRVVDADARPVANARVRAFVVMPWFSFTRETTSGADGAFAFDAMPDAKATRASWSPQAWIEADAAGFARSLVEVSVGGAAAHAGLSIVVRRGWQLSGVVLDGDSAAPIAGARVTLASTEMGDGYLRESRRGMGFQNTRNPFADRVLATATTDDAGRWTLPHLAALDGPKPATVAERDDRRPFAGRLDLKADGHVVAYRHIRKDEDGASASVETRLWRPATIRGRVLVGAVPGSDVAVHAERVPAELGYVSTTTGDDGRFEIRDFPAARDGSTTVVVAERGRDRAKVDVVARGSETIDVPVFALPEAPEPLRLETLRVRVVDLGDGPIWGAGVSLLGAFGRGAKTDREGRTTIEAPARALPPVTDASVVASAPGYAATRADVAKSAPIADEIVVRLPAGQPVAGLVLASDGAPARGATVRAVRDGARPSPRAGTGDFDVDRLVTATDATGRFRFEDVGPGPWALSAEARSASNTPGTPSGGVGGVAPGATDVVLRLSPDARGAMCRVEITAVDDATGKPVPVMYARLRRGESEVLWVRPGPNGLSSDEVPAGTWDVRVSAEGYPLEIVRGVVVEPSRSPTRIEARLKKASPRGGRVTGSPGGDGKRSLAFFSLGRDPGAQAEVDAAGTWTAATLLPGRYRVVLEGSLVGDEGASVAAWVADENVVEVPSGDARVDVALVAAGALSVRVNDDRLQRFGDLGATDEQKSFSAKSSMTLTDGRGRALASLSPLVAQSPLEISRMPLAPGRYRVRVERPGEPAVDLDLDVVAGHHVVRTIGR